MRPRGDGRGERVSVGKGEGLQFAEDEGALANEALYLCPDLAQVVAGEETVVVAITEAVMTAFVAMEKDSQLARVAQTVKCADTFHDGVG